MGGIRGAAGDPVCIINHCRKVICVRRSGGKQNFISIRPEARRIAAKRDMNLDPTQRQTVTAWVAEGLKLSDIQTRLAAELGLRLTYMEVRLLVDDLKLTLKDPEPPKPPATIGSPGEAASKVNPPETAAGMPAAEPAAPSPGGARVAVTVDHLARPGALVSGKVTFSDGNQADWHLDQTGRLGVIPKQQGYKPSAGDVQQFQMALQTELARMGF